MFAKWRINTVLGGDFFPCHSHGNLLKLNDKEMLKADRKSVGRKMNFKVESIGWRGNVFSETK